MATATGVPERTIAVFARVLREAGLLTTGARGINAPEMTPLDATRLLISLMVTDKPSRAVEAHADFAQLRCREEATRSQRFTLEEICNIASGHTLEDAIEAVIELFAFQPEKFFSLVLFDPIESAAGQYLALKIDLFTMGATLSMLDGNYHYDNPVFIQDIPTSLSNETYSDHVQVRQRRVSIAQAYQQRSLRYQTRIRVEKLVVDDVIRDIAAGFRADAEAEAEPARAGS